MLEAVFFRTFERILKKDNVRLKKIIIFCRGLSMAPSKLLLNVPFLFL